ncbi:1-acyl-sn-glycerol-3-phosphate acyltransferase [Streptacidiphilus neutrinimicus]|uniref:1-acyl-sn-glycerol-3-phosphate acyltransferase n=1 Tax=Streptacidiphilus neutrinimicus TaxID=105420 RepID=UPI000694CE7D|nr:1-acyl-sn-glycerol-3-phosphate acyltransferase [Streptacidiphilus neutrinimicus]
MSAVPPRAAARLRTCARRLVSVPLAVVLASLALVAVLVAALVAPFAAVAGRPWRSLRFAAFLLCYACVDLAGVVAAAWFWVRCLRPVPGRSRAERLQAHSYEVLARLLDRLYWVAGPVFGLRLEVDPAVPPPGRAGAAPLLVFARHAGPGDSFLLVRMLLCEAGLRPQLVLKRFLRWDPCLDVLVGRTPHVFVPPQRTDRTAEHTVDAIAALGTGLGPGEAVVIFPEGGNFTRRRRARAISWLRRHGERRRAARAERRRHVLPPRLDGPLALLTSAVPAADVVFVAHTGLDGMDTASRVWRGVPLRAPVAATWWRVPGAEVPAGRAAAEEWLERQWSRVDAWIAERSGRASPLGR